MYIMFFEKSGKDKYIYICSHCLSNHNLLWMSLYEAEDDVMAYIEDSTLIWS